MLNKEFLMVGSASLEPVLSIYISPDLASMPAVSGTLSSGQPFTVSKAGETTFKFSEIDLAGRIRVKYDYEMQLSTHNLATNAPPPTPSEGISRAPSLMIDYFWIADRTQSASISLS